MRKLIVILCLAAASAWGQEALDSPVPAGVASIQDLDLSEASLHQAGPDSFYVRGVGIGDDTYSLTFTRDSSGIWMLSDLNPESDNLLPERTVLDFASLTAVDSQTLRIDGVFVDGQVYAGSLLIGENADLSLVGSIDEGDIDSVNETRSVALAELVVAESTEAFRAEFARQKAELEAKIAELEEERDTLAALLEATPDTDERVASLLKERDDLAGSLVGVGLENNSLRDQNKTLADQIEELRVENTVLLEDLGAMNNEVERLAGLMEEYRTTQSAAARPESTDLTDEAEATAEAELATEAEPETEIKTKADTAMDADAESEAAATEPVDAEPEVATEPPAPVWAVPGDYLRKADLEAATAEVTAELKSLEARVANLETAAQELASLEEALRTGISEGLSPSVAAADLPGSLPGNNEPEAREEPPAETVAGPDPEPAAAIEMPARTTVASAAAADLEVRLAEISARLAELVEINATLRQEKLELENKILNDILSDGFIAMMRTRLTETVTSGFAAGEPDIGEWDVSSGRAVQRDSDAFFAKLALPTRQADKPMLYSFRARSLDSEGWVGLGLHFFVSDVELRRGYGMGRSLLVWLTRDPDVYKTRNTYLQLYRSDDDINMGRVLDAVIQEPISGFIDVEILYEPDNQYLTVAVDGEDKIRYRTWFGIDAGVEVAFRTLGAAEFSNFRMRTEPAESASLPGGAFVF